MGGKRQLERAGQRAKPGTREQDVPVSSIAPDGYSINVGGCCDTPGDADNTGSVNISDLTYYVDYLFSGGPGPVCMEEFDNDGNCSLDISDLTYHVDYMFAGGLSPVGCHICP